MRTAAPQPCAHVPHVPRAVAPPLAGLRDATRGLGRPCGATSRAEGSGRSAQQPEGPPNRAAPWHLQAGADAVRAE